METASTPARRFVAMLQEYSVPLILGVFAALTAANLFHEQYEHWIEAPVFFGLSLHFVVNDLFMVLFFGIAAKEITQSLLPGGDLNPFRKAINPLMATLGGVYGPILVYLGLAYVGGGWETYSDGWGIPTATDIALAWLVARLVFGAKHPAVNFLLLLAVADDAIGLGIIAVAYPDPDHAVQPMYLALTGLAAAVAYAMRRRDVQSWMAYLVIPGTLSWCGLHFAHLHPALALCAVVPFMPSVAPPKHQTGHSESTLDRFEHSLKAFVDFGLFFFAFANAGVLFSNIGPGTFYVVAALVVGKTLGITGFSWAGVKMGFPLPKGMGMKHLVMTGLIAGLGLTVALFVAGEAFTGIPQAEAKMGALMSGLVAIVAIVLGRILRVKEVVGDDDFDDDDELPESPEDSVDSSESVPEDDAILA